MRKQYSTGKRKEATARVWVFEGSGKLIVNGKENYFSEMQNYIVFRALQKVGKKDSLDVSCTVKGGGISAQAGAISLGIARSLIKIDPSLKPLLKSDKLITRDKRVVERKKYGLKKARKNSQFVKR